ncbi:MAG: hypothetical protein LBP55_07885 [Candidatus Adiutrix sp.]|jgi:hypothetical protein|nr:hypothetical protein [Candidatus Adiutrix sp.]
MKINPEHLNHLAPASPTSPKGPNQPADLGFARLLDKTQLQAAAEASPGHAQPVSGLLGNDPLVGLILANQSLAEKSAGPEQQVEKALDQMEKYAAALGDPDRSLRDIAPLAEDLQKSAGQLAEISQGLLESNPLKGLANDTAVLATVEAMKFRRGDYV